MSKMELCRSAIFAENRKVCVNVAPPHEGARPNKSIFMIRVQEGIHPYVLNPESKYFCNCPASVRVTHRMRLNWSMCLTFRDWQWDFATRQSSTKFSWRLQHEIYLSKFSNLYILSLNKILIIRTCCIIYNHLSELQILFSAKYYRKKKHWTRLRLAASWPP